MAWQQGGSSGYGPQYSVYSSPSPTPSPDGLHYGYQSGMGAAMAGQPPHAAPFWTAYPLPFDPQNVPCFALPPSLLNAQLPDVRSLTPTTTKPPAPNPPPPDHIRREKAYKWIAKRRVQKQKQAAKENGALRATIKALEEKLSIRQAEADWLQAQLAKQQRQQAQAQAQQHGYHHHHQQHQQQQQQQHVHPSPESMSSPWATSSLPSSAPSPYLEDEPPQPEMPEAPVGHGRPDLVPLRPFAERIDFVEARASLASLSESPAYCDVPEASWPKASTYDSPSTRHMSSTSKETPRVATSPTDCSSSAAAKVAVSSPLPIQAVNPIPFMFEQNHGHDQQQQQGRRHHHRSPSEDGMITANSDDERDGLMCLPPSPTMMLMGVAADPSARMELSSSPDWNDFDRFCY